MSATNLGIQGSAGTPDLLTSNEVAGMFRVDPQTVRRWADAGRISCIRTPGGHRRFPRAEVHDLLRDGGGA